MEETEPRASLAWSVLDTPIGPLLVAATERGLVRVGFHAGSGRARRRVTDDADALGADVVEDRDGTGLTAPAVRELTDYFAGRRQAFDLVIDWSLSGGFAERVLTDLYEHVPFGRSIGYGELATRAGDPSAAQAVGAAMGSNPVPVVVPCHRVVESGGGLGGFGGGLETKRWLLAHEGLLPAPLF
ncbi:MAG: methylated-DNA--[protein]-cysteine S-methyltransferase [Streptosporangiales bacterium]|nr:methylated-DNA--[protein]-cysteine S-methyltransferase [Streptosporangiales bacterium]